MQFDGTLTINGSPYWQETHFKHVQTIQEKYAMKAVAKPQPLIEKKIESKHGQIKKKRC